LRDVILAIEFSPKVLTELFEADRFSTGMTKEAPGGVTIQLRPLPIQRRGLAMDSIPMLSIAITARTNIALSLFSNWLYDKLKGSKVRTIRVHRRTVEVTPDGIYKVIEESMQVEERK
jgi:hypothetical protein